MTVGIHQPQYLPWLGYFDKINRVDAFVLLDDVQFKKNEWQNRNKIRNIQGWQWITAPVKHKFPELINEVKINNSINWKRKHYQSLVANYSKAPHFKDYQSFFEKTYQKDWQNLADVNIYFIRHLIKFLGINVQLLKSSEATSAKGQSTTRLVNICKELGADSYLSGRGGKNYLDARQFEKNNIKVIFQEFEHPQYQQAFEGFEPFMSIIDLLFNHGEDSLKIIKGEKNEKYFSHWCSS